MRQFDLPANDVLVGGAKACHALLVPDFGFPAGHHAEFLRERGAEFAVPADRGMAVAVGEGGAHQLAVGGLVGGLGLDEPCPRAAVPQEFPIARAEVLAPGLCPLLVQRVGQQVAGVGGGNLGAHVGVVSTQCGRGGAFEAVDVGLYLPRGKEEHAPAPEHHGVVVAQCLPGMMRGLPQVRRAGRGIEVRPQRVDDLITQTLLIAGQREQLHEFGGASQRPAVLRGFTS